MEEKKEEQEDWRGTVLEKVLSSLCSYHRTLLYSILQNMRQDYSVALAQRDAHWWRSKTEPYCCLSERKSSDSLPYLLSNCTTAGCLTPCGLRTCTVTSVCICMKSLNGLTCQNLTVRCGKVICPSSTVCCPHHKILVCPHTSENLCITHANRMLGVQFNHPGILNSHNTYQTCRSPSPPPLSPRPVDMECKTGDQTASCKGQDLTAPSKPPPLLHHQTEAEGEDKAPKSDTLRSGEFPTALVKDAQSDTEEESKHCGSFLGDIMDKFTEKLKNIRPSEKEQTTQSTHASQNTQTCDDTHLTEIITTVLHNSSDKEYDLKELFEQRMAAEPRSPQTRSRRRQDRLAAMSKSPDLPASRRQSLQIKRDLARLDPTACKRKLMVERSKCLKNAEPSTHTVEGQSSFPESVPETIETEPLKEQSVIWRGAHSGLSSETTSCREEQEKQPGVLQEILQCNETDQQQTVFSHRKTISKYQQVKSKTLQPNDEVGRSRRKIVPPPRFSSYVTEPRKMYYAACYSESLFVKHSSNIKATGTPDFTEIFTSTKSDTESLIKTEGQDHVMHPLSEDINTLTGSPKKISENESGDCTSPAKRTKLCGVQSIVESQNSESSDTGSPKDTKQLGLTYVSPIKLMLVSPVKSKTGVKYTLKAADVGSDYDGEMFDPCVESSWAGKTMSKQTLPEDVQIDSAQNVDFMDIDIKLPEVVVSTDEVDLTDSASGVGEALPAVRETTPVKRRRGRPKKLGPQIEKAVKRPIGRPPKAKNTDPSGLSGNNDVNPTACKKSSEDDGNKNLKITITYGRSRKARRVVSEALSTNQTANEVHSSSTSNETKRMNTSEDLHFVMPVEDRKGLIHSSSTIKCQKQSDLAMTRKPGRPPKVKISGISVTVTTVSPRQRKIHMKRDIKAVPLQRKTLVMDFEPSEKQKTVSDCTGNVLIDGMCSMEEGAENSRASFVPIRHSIRERKPSVHLLYSVATARSLSRSSGLICRSHKLLMNKPSSETNHQTHQVAANSVLSTKMSKVSQRKSVLRFSGVSVDSIFAMNESLKWWPITASPETLNEELARRIRLMSDTWVSGVLEAKKSEDIKNQTVEPCEKVTGCDKRSSAVKMLFERNYSREKLCSWFMQTTETQSLPIVKKASARNPYDIFHYNPIRSTSRENVCPSPQAERLRKHVKKFAKVIPKSPAIHRQAQATVYPRQLFAKRYLFKPSCGTWVDYRTTLLRAKSKFKTRARKAITTVVEQTNHRDHLSTSPATTGLSKVLVASVNIVQDSSNVSESNLSKIETSEKTLGITGIPKEERISSKAWSPETLKECRVFLKKINSPNTKSVTEDCNLCSVKFNISPAGCDVSIEKEEHISSETTMLEKPFSSSTKSLSSTVDQNKSAKKRRGSQASELPPAKMMRQSRSSRGVLGARWCDFVLGKYISF